MTSFVLSRFYRSDISNGIISLNYKKKTETKIYICILNDDVLKKEGGLFVV